MSNPLETQDQIITRLVNEMSDEQLLGVLELIFGKRRTHKEKANGSSKKESSYKFLNNQIDEVIRECRRIDKVCAEAEKAIHDFNTSLNSTEGKTNGRSKD